MIRSLIIRAVVYLLLPPEVWVAKHKGVYTQKYQVTFGRLDNRGVLQGVTAKDAMKGG